MNMYKITGIILIFLLVIKEIYDLIYFKNLRKKLIKFNNFLKIKRKTIDKEEKILRNKIENITNLSLEEAREIVLENARKISQKEIHLIEEELKNLAQQKIKDIREKADQTALEIIISSLEKLCIKDKKEWNDSEKIKVEKASLGKIIGTGGKNTNHFKKITGCEMIFQKKIIKKEGLEYTSVEISSFNSLRKKIGILTLKELIKEQKITPSYIEKVFERVSLNFKQTLAIVGREIVEELKIEGISEEVQFMIGKSRYMSAGYGQNLESHLKEVSILSGIIASNIGLDPSIARRAGLLHDIGKTTGDINISHVTSGVEIAKKIEESDIIINTIESHHDRSLANNFYSLIVSVADKLSAGRKGARNNQIESYINRIKELERLKERFSFIKEVYPFQAGREILIFVKPKEILDDIELIKISKEIRDYIQVNIIIPGDVVINIIKEVKITEKIVNSGRVNSEKVLKENDEVY